MNVDIKSSWIVFNWIPLFEIGLLWKRRENNMEEFRYLMVIMVLSFLIFIGLFVSVLILDMPIEDYWSWWSMPYEVSGFLVFLEISKIFRNNRFLQDIGKNTLFIYLAHLQVVGVINTRLPQNGFFYLIKGCIALTVMYAGMLMIRRIAKVNHMGFVRKINGIKN